MIDNCVICNDMSELNSDNVCKDCLKRFKLEREKNKYRSVYRRSWRHRDVRDK